MRDSELAILGAAAVAAILLSPRTAGARPAAAPTPGPSPAPPAAQPDAPPAAPTWPAAGPVLGEVPRTGGAYPLEQGGRYRARVELSGMEALFGSTSAVGERFERVGFGGVSARDLGGGAYEVDGTWTGPTGAYPGPSQITRVWRIG